MRVLILGGNGFIGSAIALRVATEGHVVVALARDVARAARRMPDISWVRADIAKLATPTDWTALIAGVEAVVNCAGALQDGARDDVAALQDVAMQALYAAARDAGTRLIVQVSARTDAGGSATRFLATKRRADAALAALGVPFVILRPAVVIGRNAHGGSALLRALAAFPVITPLVHAKTAMQFAALDDVGTACADALAGRIGPGSDLDIAATEILSLAEAVALHRRWLGLSPATMVNIPPAIAHIVAFAADRLGDLGWRSPLRSTAMRVAAEGVTAANATGQPAAKTLADTMRDTPAGVQDLWFARLYLLKPLIFGTLALFWLLSGLIALIACDASCAHLERAGASPRLAATLVIATSLVDIVLGIGIAVRRWAAPASIGMMVMSVCYLLGATILTPALWADPLGPLVKVLPSIVLAMVALAILDER